MKFGSQVDVRRKDMEDYPFALSDLYSRFDLIFEAASVGTTDVFRYRVASRELENGKSYEAVMVNGRFEAVEKKAAVEVQCA